MRAAQTSTTSTRSRFGRLAAAGLAAALTAATLVAAPASAASWGTPGLISAAATADIKAVGNPVLKASATGAIVLATWRSDDSSVQGQVLASRSTDGGATWSAPALISNPAGSNSKAEVPVATLSADGSTAVVAWRSTNSSSHSEVWANRFAAGAWSGPQLISEAASANRNVGTSTVVITGASNGSNATVAWRSITSDNRGEIRGNRFSAGTWGTSGLISEAATADLNSQNVPAIAGSSDGSKVTVAWRSCVTSGDCEARANRFASDVWGSATLISDAASGTLSVQESVTAISSTNGEVATVAWRISNGTYNAIRGNRFSGGSWGTAGLISTAPDIATNAQGTPILVGAEDGAVATAIWRSQVASGRGQVRANRFAAGSWGTPTVISTESDDSEIQNTPAAAGSADGRVVTVAWRVRPTLALHYEIQSNRFANDAWAGPTRISAPAASDSNVITSPSVAVSADGTAATAAWPSSPSGELGEIRGSHFIHGAWEAPALISNPASTTNRATSTPTLATAANGLPVSIGWRATNDSNQGSVWSNQGKGIVVPELSAVTSTADGFTFSILNHDPQFTWALSASAGSASLASDCGIGECLVTVTGLKSGQSATVTVTTSRIGFNDGSATATGTAGSSKLPQTVKGRPKAVKSVGTTVLNTATAKTKQKQKQKAKAAVKIRKGDVSCYRLGKGPGRALRITTTGQCALTIKVTYTAPATSKYRALKKTYTYQTRAVR